MSCEAVKWVLRNSKAKGSARLVLLSIAEHADRNGERAWPSIATISRETGVHRASVFRSLIVLVQIGEVEMVRSGGGRHSQTNHYRLKLVSPQLALPMPGRVAWCDGSHGATGSQLMLQRVARCDPKSPEPPKPNPPSPLKPGYAAEQLLLWNRETIVIEMGSRKRIPSLDLMVGAQTSDVVEFLSRKGFRSRIVGMG